MSLFKPIVKNKAQESLDYCVKIVKERDYENYLAALLMCKPAQPRIFSILALNAELATLRHKIRRNSGVAGIYQLTFWRDSLEALDRRDRNALLPRQPVISALQTYSELSDLPLYLNLVTARQQTLGDRPFPNVGKLEENSKLLYGSLIQLQMHALHAFTLVNWKENGIMSSETNGKEVQNVVDSMASAIGILTLLRATTLLLRDGIVLLPNDLTALHGIDSDTAYRSPESLKAVTKDLCEISAAHLAASRFQTEFILPALRPAFQSAGLRCDYLLDILFQNDFNLLDVRLHKPHHLSGWKLWWRNRQKIF